MSAVLISCEHAGHRLPPEYRARLGSRRTLLESHHGWDPGALAVARRLARDLESPLVASTLSRLLVDLNRSPHNPAVFGALGRGLPASERRALLDRHHRPHWERVRSALDARRPAGLPTLHVAVHSFAPALGGVLRDFEVGLLYDPRRPAERGLAAAWRRLLRAAMPGIRVRRNAPYRGRSDGLTTALRRERGPRAYLGLELELNQSLLADPAARRRLLPELGRTLRAIAPVSA